MTDYPESEPYRLAESPSHLLHRAEQLAADRFAQLVDEKITLRQFSVLAAIAETPGLSQSELVRATGIDRSTLADMMRRMEKPGWVVRKPSKTDARAHSVELGKAGRSILQSTAQQARAADAAILDLLPRTKARTFFNTLLKLAKRAEAVAEKAERDAKRQAKREAKQKRQKARRKPRAASAKRAPAARKQRS